jgi:hypothetical protein
MPDLSDQPDNVQKAHLLMFNKTLSLTQALSSLNTKVNALPTAASTAAATTTTVIDESSISSIGGVNNQTGATAYVCQTSDYGSLIIFNDASAIALSLNSTIAAPFFFVMSNYGAGSVTMTTTLGTLTGPSVIAQGYTASVYFDGTNWWVAEVPVVPVNTPAVAHQFFTAYASATGVFTKAQPAFSDISGNLVTSQMPTGLYSGTITTAKLTTGGTNGSMTFVNGLLSSEVAAT